MIELVLTLVVIGVVLWAIEQLPMDATIRKAIRVVVIVCVVFYLLRVFGVIGGGVDIPVPRLR
jgi:type IV secretory pathway TrbL component